MKKIVLVFLVVVFSAGVVGASNLHGTAWQYSNHDEWEQIGFYNGNIYILIDPEIAAPDPPYWSQHATCLLEDTNAGSTEFIATGFPGIFGCFGFGYSGQANRESETGTLFHWFLLPNFRLTTDTMQLVDSNFVPSSLPMRVLDIDDPDIIKDSEQSKKINSDLIKTFFKAIL